MRCAMMKAVVRFSRFAVAAHGQGPGYVTYEPPPHALIDGVAEVCLLLRLGKALTATTAT